MNRYIRSSQSIGGLKLINENWQRIPQMQNLIVRLNHPNQNLQNIHIQNSLENQQLQQQLLVNQNNNLNANNQNNVIEED